MICELNLYFINLIPYSSWKGLRWRFFLCCSCEWYGDWFWLSTVIKSFASFLARVHPFPKLKTKSLYHRRYDSIASLTCIYMHWVWGLNHSSLILWTITKPSADLKVTLCKRDHMSTLLWILIVLFFQKQICLFVCLSICWAVFEKCHCVLGCGYRVWSRHHPWCHGTYSLGRVGLK